MKTKVLLLCLALFTASFSICAANETVKGNGKIVTKEISISDYEKVSVAGSLTFEYEQSNAAPYLRVEVDENILPLLDIRTENGGLKVGPKKNKNINPTVFKVKSNSKNLAEVNSAGSGKFIVISSLDVSRLKLSKAGSGRIELKKSVKGTTLLANMAGSGEIIVKDLKVEELKCSHAGSGSISVNGEAKNAAYDLSGSGSIKAFGCKVENVKASLAASGGIEVFATSNLNASVAGSGSIKYKGEPELKKSVVGSGSIKKVN